MKTNLPHHFYRLFFHVVVFVLTTALFVFSVQPTSANTNDMTKQIVSIDPTTTYDTATKKLTVVVKNTGTEVGKDLKVYYLFGNSNTGQLSTPVTITFPVSTLPVGQKVSKQLTVTPGPADKDLHVRANVSNSYGWAEKTFVLPAGDLFAEKLQYENGKNPTLIIRNKGTADSLIPANTVKVRFEYFDEKNGLLDSGGNSYRSFDIFIPARTLKPEDTISVELSSWPEQVDAFLKASILVPSDKVIEKDYTNNFRKIAIPLPWLKILNTTNFDPKSNKVTVVIKNDGKRDAVLPGKNSVRLYLTTMSGNDTRRSKEEHPGPRTIHPGDQADFIYNLAPTGDEDSVIVSLATSENFMEMSKTHGNQKLQFPLPDLDIIEVKPRPDGYIIATVKNVGSRNLEVPKHYEIMADFFLTDEDGESKLWGQNWTHARNIPVGQNTTFISREAVPAGTASVGVTVDSDDLIVESNERNNDESINYPLPDLSIDPPIIEPDKRVSIIIKNVGDQPAVVNGAKADISWLTGGGTSFDMSGTITAGSSVKFTTPFAYPEGVTTITAHVDTTDKVVESDNKNNTSSVEAPELRPDLTISALVQDGNTISVHLKNIGFTKFEGGVNATYFWDDDVLHTSTAPLGTLILDKDAEEVKDFTVQQPSGVSTLHVTVRGVKPEERTDNNSSEITVPTIFSIDGFEKEDGLVLGGTLASVLRDKDSKSQADLAKDLGLLPDNPLYGLKELGRGIQLGVTFDVEKKIDLQNSIAGERALEANAVIDNGHASSAIGVINKNASDEEKISDALDDLRKKDPKKADDLASKIVGDRVIQQTVVDKLKNDLPVEDAVKVDKAQDKGLTATGKIIDNVKDGNKVRDALEKSAAGKGSPYIPLKHLTAMNAVSSYVANPNARLILEQAKERKQTHLKNNLLHMDSKQLGTFTGYVEKTTGDEVNTLKALDNMKLIVGDKNVRASLGTAKQHTVSKLVGEIQSAKVKDKNAGEVMLSGLKSGSITDLRVLSDLKSKDSSVNADIQGVKKTAIQNFEKKVNGLKPAEKQKFLSDVTRDHLDLTQQAVVNDIKRTLPKSSLGKDMDTILKTEVKTKVAKVKGNKKEYDEFLETVSGETRNDKEAITAFTAGFDSSFFKDLMRQQLNYMQAFYAGADPETKKFLDQYYFTDPTIKAFYTDFDSAFTSLFSGFNEADFTSDEDSEETWDEDYSDDTNTTSGCAMIDAPVCGTDGLNYANECEAHDNGADVAYTGECHDDSQTDESSDVGGGEEDVEGASTVRIPALVPYLWHRFFH